jgi:DNA-binding response OmpR family regulator
MATVLLVEDERKLRELVRSYLERAGYMVLSTGSGAEAISLASSAAPDLVVLDLGLPDVPGEAVAREIRALVLRVQAILRRGTAAATEQGVSRFGGGTLVIDEPRRATLVRGAEVELTPTEWGLLITLSTVPGRVYSRFELINRVRGYEFEGYERTVDSHVKNLRRKIEEEPGNPVIIQTVLGGGYRLGITRDG